MTERSTNDDFRHGQEAMTRRDLIRRAGMMGQEPLEWAWLAASSGPRTTSST